MKSLIKIKALAFIVAGACGASQVFAQEGRDNTDEELRLETLVVTGVATAATQMEASVSTSGLNSNDLNEVAAINAADILRNLPGIRAEASAGEVGNAQIAVRGLPVAAGGAKFLLLQEDGLPVMQFGDIAFGNADTFIRPDSSIGRVEAVRGGSASTLVSNSPGGIVNFISKTGEIEGGSIGTTFGLDYDHFRTDFEYGGEISDSWYGHIGGFFREGEGVREVGYNAHSGGQIKANLTREFDSGYVRLYLKSLRDSAPSFLPMPLRSNGTSLPGFDVLLGSQYSPFLSNDVSLGESNERVTRNVQDGVDVDVNAVGFEFAFDLNENWNVINKFRTSQVSADWVGPFTASVGDFQSVANQVASLVPGADISNQARVVYANGPRAGLQFIGNENGNGLAQIIHLFNTDVNNQDSYVNDLRFSGNLRGATLSLGVYRASQSIDQTWHWNSYLQEVSDSDAAFLDVYDASGTQLSQNGLYAYGVPLWGFCCQRNYDLEYTVTAPYANLNLELDNLSLDFGVRYDEGTARGSFAGSVQSTVDINSDGVIQPNERSVSGIDVANANPINYDWDYVSYTAGVNYLIGDNSAIFGRISHGARANADRLAFGPNINLFGGLVDEEAAIDEVDQLEFGYKRQGEKYELFATAFYAETEESNFEATSQRFTDRSYEAYGVEVEGVVEVGNFTIESSLTWTDAEIIEDALNPAVVGATPRRQPDLLFSFRPTMNFFDESLRVGLNLIGQSEAFSGDNNDLELDSFLIANLFLNYRITENMSVAVQVNNLTDEEALTEAEEGSAPAPISGTSTLADGLSVIRGRTYPGRSTSLSLRYEF